MSFRYNKQLNLLVDFMQLISLLKQLLVSSHIKQTKPFRYLGPLLFLRHDNFMSQVVTILSVLV